MTNENKNKIIDRVIDFLHNKPLRSDMRIAAALIEELKLVKNCSIPAVIKCDSFEREVSVCCDTYIKIGAICYQNMNVCIGKKCKYYPAN